MPQPVEHGWGIDISAVPMSIQAARVKALCFDVDGTLADTDDQFVETLASWLRPVEWLPVNVHKALAKHYYSPETKISKILARRFVMGIETPANALFGLPDRLHLDKPFLDAGEWLRETTPRIAQHSPQESSLVTIAGVQEMLAQLHSHFPLSVVSARGERGTMRFLERYNLTGYFTCIATALTCRHTKPYPDPILWAAEKMGVQPYECLMIGDTTVDIRAGRAAGAQTMGVLCGFGSQDELQQYGADEIVAQTPNILGYLTI